MAHVTLTEVLRDARQRKYGIPNLWGGSVEKVIGHVRAAEAKRSPLIMCYNHGLCPLLPVEIGVPLIVNAARHAEVPVATILDHGSDFQMILKCIHHGISSVMFDGSALDYEENVRQTAEVARIAHPLRVSVEGELGAVGGSAIETGGYSEAKSVMTDPGQASDFVRRTGVDALAISFGNVHGRYEGTPSLDLDRVRRIAASVDVPLVMHGASGLADRDYAGIIESGISKINYYTAMAVKAAENTRQKTAQACKDLVCHNLMAWNIEFYIEETNKLLDLLGCSGKAPAAASDLNNREFDKILVEEVSKAVREAMSKDRFEGI